MLLIYTNHITSRLQYIVPALFGNEVLITDSKEKLQQHNGPKINYSGEKTGEAALWVQPYGLLNEETIKPQKIECAEWNGLKVFFQTKGDIPFDIFAASFYLLTRYEEYLPHQKDEYGRYAYTNSLAYKENFLHLPLVNLWLKELEKKDSKFKIQNSKFSFIPTYDIDIAYSYLHHSWIRNIMGFFRDMVNSRFDKVVERANVYSGTKKDPFDVYDWLDALHRQHLLNPVYFFLMATHRSEYDKNLSPHTKAMKKLIRQHAEKYTVGIHPSFAGSQAGRNAKAKSEKLSAAAEEIQLLQHISQHTITRSRQHYIKMELPGIYHSIIHTGIKDDYSMGYGSINGFRASYTLPYRWYNVEKEEETGLMIHPFCFMDAISIFQQKHSPAEALQELQYYHDIVQSVNGQLITIFHNHFLTAQPQWLARRKMYEAFLKKNFDPDSYL